MESLGRWLVTSTWTKEQRQQAAPPRLTGITAAAIKDFVHERFGSECVRRVVAQNIEPALQAKWEEHHSMADMVDEEVYLQVFVALARWAHMDLYNLLFEYGQHLILYLAENAGYGRSIHRVAATFPGFCRGLTQFMNQLFESMGNTKNLMPQVAVKDETADSFTLLLIGSKLPARPPVLWGVLDRIASHVFDLHITIEPVSGTYPGTQVCHGAEAAQAGMATSGLCDTVQGIRIRMSSLSATSRTRTRAPHQEASPWDSNDTPTILGPRPEDFYQLYPFHFVMDRRFRLLQAGVGMRKVLPEMVPGAQVNELLTILHPTVPWDVQTLDLVLEDRMTAKVVFETFDGLLHLKGGLYRIRPITQHAGAVRAGSTIVDQHEEDVLLFVGSPNCSSFDSMASHHLYLSDLPAYDMTADYVLMADHRKAKMRDLERTAQSLLEERRCNSVLKETLAEALATQVDAAGSVTSNSAMDVTLKLLDAIIMRDEVNVHQVLYVRDALLRAGTNLWRPINFDSRNIDRDSEVNAALGTLLGTNREEFDEVDDAELATAAMKNSRSVEHFLSDPEGLVGDLDDPQLECKASCTTTLSHMHHVQSSPVLCDLDTTVVVQPGATATVALSVSRHESGDRKASAIRLLLEPTTELSRALKGVDEWQFDVFALDRASNGHCLSVLGFHLFKRFDLIKQLHLSEPKLIRYLMRIEQGYQQTPYHSRIHAADVLRTMHVLLSRGGVMEVVVAAARQSQLGQAQPGQGSGAMLLPTSNGQEVGDHLLASFPFKMMVCYLAAVIHDYEHRGLTNDFLIRSSDDLALRYNDNSPLENHHLSAALTLMREDQYGFLPTTSKKIAERVRKHLIELVLSTDMKQHFALVGQFNSKADQDRPERDSTQRGSSSLSNRGSGGCRPRNSIDSKSRSRRASLHLSESSNSAGVVAPSWDAETRLLMLKMALKCADLGHLSSSLEVHTEWVKLLEEELFLQGDKERALGQPISPLMDRTKAGVTKSQVGFFSVVALPLFSAFAQMFPAADGLVANVRSNYNHWREVEGAFKQ